MSTVWTTLKKAHTKKGKEKEKIEGDKRQQQQQQQQQSINVQLCQSPVYWNHKYVPLSTKIQIRSRLELGKNKNLNFPLYVILNI